MEPFLAMLGSGTAGAILGFLLKTLVDHAFGKSMAKYEHDLSLIAGRLDFLHQERAKAAMAVVHAVKEAEMYLKLVINPQQAGPVDHDKEALAAEKACVDLQNLIADTSFLFPEHVERAMLDTRTKMWNFLDEWRLISQSANQRRVSRSQVAGSGDIHVRFANECAPLVKVMVQQIRQMLGADKAT